MGRVCVSPSSTGNGSLHVVMQIGRGARPSVTTLPNEAMSLKGKQLGTLSCVPAKFELLISGPVLLMIFCCFIGLAKIVSRPTCECPCGIHFINFFSCHGSHIAESCSLSANM